MTFKWIFTLPLLLTLMACHSVVPELPQVSTKMQKNKTAQLLDGKRLTSAMNITHKNLYIAEHNWCQYTDNLNPDTYLRIRSGLCYAQYPDNRTLYYLREFSRGDGNYLKFPKASNAELQQLRQDLIQMDFASISSMSGKPDVNKGYWQAIFCYEDLARPQERAKCLEVTNPLTHPKTDAVMKMLQRFARGNSMDPR